MIKGKKLSLNPIQEKDLKNLFSLVSAYSSHLPKAFLSESIFLKTFSETGLWQPDEASLLILDPYDRILGIISFEKEQNIDAFTLKLSLFRQEDQTIEIFTEALQLIDTFLFQEKQANRLQIFIANYQDKMIEGAKNCGFTFEGILRKALFFQGNFTDICVFSLLKDEWLTNSHRR